MLNSAVFTRGRGAAVAAVVLLPFLAACGASIQAIYEGDVRFEHCMALDSRPDGKPTIRRACWQEWVKFYTFGQTRDRVEYAKLREKQLSVASDFDEGEWISGDDGKTASAVPDPTTALAPPPMLLSVDGGAPAESTATDAAPPLPPLDKDKPPNADCAGECEETWNFCRQECKAPACEKGCMGKYKRCMRACF